MDTYVVLPKSVKKSEKLERLHRLHWDYACRPASYTNERWAGMRIAGSGSFEKVVKEGRHKHMIQEVDKGVKGLDFPAAEMAMIIRGMMAQDD